MFLQVAVLVATSIPAQANPLAPTVVAGHAAFDASGATLSITTSDRAVIDWQSFGINAGEMTQFIQPNAHSAVLNRVSGGDPSALLGTLQANGQVYLINPNGIVVGAGAHINAGSFMATTLDIDNALFMRGGNLDFKGNSNAAVINHGIIRAIEGNVYLVANRVENHGIISAVGHVGLAAASDVRVVDGAHPQLVVRPTSASTGNANGGVVNTGLIEATRAELIAAHGNVYALAINNAGTIRTNGVEVNEDGIFLKANGGRIVNTGNMTAKNADGSGGNVVIDSSSKTSVDGVVNTTAPATGSVAVSGTVDVSADAAGKSGGSVQITSDNIELVAANINADGPGGGGDVRIGGDYQGGAGSPAPLPNAVNLTIDAATKISASATQSGNAGRVIAWSDGTTRYAGDITARGAAGGAGGFAEVSGKQVLEFIGGVNLGGGMLLLDPGDFTIDATTAASIVSALASSDVKVTTNGVTAGNGDVFINSAIVYNSSRAFQILAHRHINVNADVLNAGSGAIGLIAGWDGVSEYDTFPGVTNTANLFVDGFASRPETFGNNGGSVYLDRTGTSTRVAVGATNGTLLVAGFDVLLKGSDTSELGDAQIGLRPTTATGGGGGIVVRANNDVSVIAQLGAAHIGLGVDNTAIAAVAVAARTGSIDVLAGRDVVIQSGTGINTSYALIGHGGLNADASYSGDITVNAGRNLSILAGSNGSIAMLGHGGYNTNGSILGDIYVTAVGEVTLRGGSGFTTYAQLGHGGEASASASDNAAGNIRVEAAKLSLESGFFSGAYAQIGHGGNTYTSSNGPSGAIDVTVTGELSFSNGGAGASRIGHWSNTAVSFTNAPVRISVAAVDSVFNNATPATTADLTNIFGNLVNSLKGGSVTFTATGVNGNDGNVIIPTFTASSSSGNTLTLKSTGSATFANAGTFNGSSSFAIIANGDLNISNVFTRSTGTGGLTLRGDGDANGVGNVLFSGAGKVNFTGASGKISIQYNPTSYTTPTSFISPGLVTLGSSGASLSASMLVNNVTQLQAISTNLGGNYLLGRDIDASATATWNAGAGFAPITGFSGTFSGDGHVVADLFINRPATNLVGLFGSATGSGSISNIGLINANVTGANRTGGLVGESFAGVSNVFVEGTIKGNQYTGGLIGWNGGTISNAYSGAGVVATASGAGGLVGNHQFGLITNSYATGSVAGTTDVGGLVGINEISISNVYASGRVTGTTRIGGLIGTNNSVVTNGYYDSVTTGAAGAGTAVDSSTAFTQASYTGFDFTNTWYIRGGSIRPILRSEYSTTIETAHQLQLIDLDPLVNYTLARNIDLAETRNTSGSGVWKQGSGWVQISGFFAGNFDGAGHTLDGFYSRSGALFANTSGADVHDLKMTNVDIVGSITVAPLISSARNFTTIRNIQVSGSVQGTIQVAGVVATITNSSLDNVQSSATVIGGSVVGGLVAASTGGTIRNSSATGNVSGTGSIGGLVGATSGARFVNSFATGSILATGGGGGLVGSATRTSFDGTYATGAVQFDTTATSTNPSGFGGLIGTIAQSTVYRSYATGNVTAVPTGVNTGNATGGLIGMASNSYVSTTYATGIVSGYSNAGGLIGVSFTGAGNNLNGVVDKSYATGAVSGFSQVGGLIGSLQNGTLTASFATGAVSATDSIAGGLVGGTFGIIRNTYATGSVTAPATAGGLVGFTTGVVDRSYSIGAVTGTTTVGGLIGNVVGATVTSSYWNTQTSGRATSAGGAGAAGRTTAQMKTQSNFTGWDFVNVWEIYEGVTYPRLQYETIPGVTVVGTVYTDDGVTKIGAGTTVTLLQNGVVVGSTITNGSSIYKFMSPLANNDSLVAYINDNVTAKGATGWRTDGASTTTLDIFGTTLLATAAAAKFADNAMFAQAAGSVVDTDILYSSTTGGGTTNISLAQGIRFLLPVGQTYRLDGNLSTAGGNVDMLGTLVVSAAAPTIRTDVVGGALAAGNVNFAATGSINALTAGGQGLIVNTTADGGGTAGAVRLGDVGTTTRLNGLTIATGAGLLTLTDTDADGIAKILVTTGNVDFSNAASVQLNADLQISTQPTAAGQGSVLFQLSNAQILGNAAGRNIAIDVRGTTTGVDDDGDVTLPAFIGSNGIIGGSLEVLTDKGTITLGNGTFATYKMRDTGAGFGIRFLGDAVLTGDITFESNNSVADFGSTTFSSNALGRWGLTIRSDGGFNPAAEIRFAGADNAGGNYLRGITLDSDSFFFPTDGKVTLVDDRDNLVSILTDTDVSFFTGFAVQTNNLILEDSTYIGSVGNSPGGLNLGTALIDAKFDNLSLELNTVGVNLGGSIQFGNIGRDTITGGGHYLGNFTAATNGSSFFDGRTVLASDITIDNTLGTGAVNITGRVGVVGTRTITTQVGNDNAAGSVSIIGSIFATADAGLVINTSVTGANAAGNVTLTGVGNDNGDRGYVRTIDIDARGASGGAIVFGGSTLTLDGYTTVANAARLTALGNGIVFNSNMTINTEVGNDQSGGSVNFGATPISATAAGFDLTIDTASTVAGGVGGDITLGTLGNGTVAGLGGFYLNDLSLNASGVGAGRITSGNILLDALGTDLATVVMNGRYVLSQTTRIDTEAGNDAAAGAVDLRLAVVSAAATGYDLTIDTSTTLAGAAAGNLQLRTFNAGGGQLVNAVSLDARPGTGGTAGTLTLDGGMTLASNFSFVGGAASLSTASAFILSGGNIGILSTSGAASGIAMTSGSALRTASGNITLRANGAISLSRLNADDDSDDSRGDVIVVADFDNSGAGSILDNLAGEVTPNILARNVSLSAADKIGNITDFTTGAGDGIDLNLSGSLQSAVVTQAGGNIFLVFQGSVAADAGAIVVNQTGLASLILQASADIDLGTAGNALVLSAGDNVAISAGQVLTLPSAGVDVGTGQLRLVGTSDIRDSDRSLGSLVAADLTFTSGNSGGNITVATTVGTLTAQVTANNLTINEADGLTALSLNAGSGDVTLTAGGAIADADGLVDIIAANATIQLNGNFGSSTNAIATTVASLSVDSTNGSQFITETNGLTALSLAAGTGDVTLTAGGAISDTDTLEDIIAANATIQLNGNFGSSTNAITTTVASLSVDSTNGNQFINETNGLTALSLAAGTGDVTLTAGGAISDTESLADIVAANATIQLNGNFGSSTNAIATTVAGLSVNSTNGSQWINQTNGLTALSLAAGTGDVTLTAGGAISDTDSLEDIIAANATIQLNGNFGSSTNAITTTVASLSVDSANGSQFITETNGLTALSLAAGTGDITLTTGGAILDSDAAVDLAAASAVIRLTTGDFGSGASAIGTTLADLSIATDDGSQWISETDGLTAIAFSALGVGHDITLSSTTGDLRLVSLQAADRITLDAVAGAIQDAGSETGPQLLATTIDLTAVAGIGLTANGDLDFNATHISAVNTTSGGIFLEKLGVGPVTFDLVDLQNAGGAVDLAAAVLTTLTDVRSVDGSITVNVTGANDLRVVDVHNFGSGSIDLVAGRDIQVHREVAAIGGGILLQSGADVTLDTGVLSQNVAVRSLSGDVRVDAGRDVGLSASAGYVAELGSQAGAVRVAAVRDVALLGDTSGTARIGGGAGSSGNIEVLAGRSALLEASSSGMALVGHVAGSGDLLVVAGLDLILRSSAGATAQIGHLTTTGVGKVDVAWNQAAQPFRGLGRLVMSRTVDGTTSITAGGSPARVRLFGGLRDGFVFLDTGIIINSHPFTGTRSFNPVTPIAGLAGSPWDQNFQFLSWPMEQWGFTTLSSTTTETSPFTFYFNSQKSGFAAAGLIDFFGVLNGLGFQYDQARYLLDGPGRSINVPTMAETGEPSFDARRRAEIGAEITGGSSL